MVLERQTILDFAAEGDDTGKNQSFKDVQSFS